MATRYSIEQSRFATVTWYLSVVAIVTYYLSGIAILTWHCYITWYLFVVAIVTCHYYSYQVSYVYQAFV